MVFSSQPPGAKARPIKAALAWLCFLLIAFVATAAARAEERFPPPEFRSGYVLPTEQRPLPRDAMWQIIDVAALAVALGVAAWLIHGRRRRWAIFALSGASLAYFGFYRQGCVCPIGSIQNVSAAALGGEGLPWTVAAFFGLPLVVALFAGRAFCSGVCPLGAIQDVVLFRPIQVPRWAESALGIFAHFYLALAIVLAATGTDFVICAYDPFVGFFRMSGGVGMLMTGGLLLLLSMFVGRAYCRWICPYSVLLRLVSPLARWKVRVSPTECVDCRLCEKSCPFGAIEAPVRGRVNRADARQRLGFAGVAALAMLLTLPVFGYASRTLLGRMDARVQLAHRVAAEEAGRVTDRTDASLAWRKTGEGATELYARAAEVERKLGWGAAFVGLWVAIAAGWRGMRASAPAHARIYDADPAGCVACARCFEDCPIELDRRGVAVPLTVGGSAVTEKRQEVGA